MQRRCAYLTMDDIGGFVSDAGLSIAPMAELGWDVDMVSWRNTGVDWDRYDLVYICTPWDYQDDVTAFLALLARIDASSATLVNSLELVRWNLEKSYLRGLESRGAGIVPSVYEDAFDPRRVDAWFDMHGTAKVVVKPVVGANSDDVTVLSKPVSAAVIGEMRNTFGTRPFFVQPFIESILAEGEYSLFFFGGDYSHAILKKPAAGDFRSQEEHGAAILGIEAPCALLETAGHVVSLVDPEPVYVRADFVRAPQDRFLLMELELIEPSLYFRADPDSARRFARAVDERFEKLTGK